MIRAGDAAAGRPRDLIIGLQLIAGGEGAAGDGGLPEASVFAEELRNMRVKVGLNGHETYEHWRSGDHDDPVPAVAPACRQARKWRDRVGCCEAAAWR